MNIIVDYGLGNLGSVIRGFNRAGIETKLSRDLDEIKNADSLILPGVGAFGDAMNDREMLGLVGRGVIMGNAMGQLKAALPHLPIIGNCKNQAVSHYLAHWLDTPNLPYSPE